VEATLASTRGAADLVILALHWGVPPQWQSNFQGPLAEYQEALAPRLVAAGADLVLGHHAHTVYGIQAFARPQASPGLVCFSFGNYIFHSRSPRRRAPPLDAPSRPYHAPERPENRDSFIGTFTIGHVGDRLAVQQARLQPSVLNEAWEAASASPEAATPHCPAPLSVLRLAPDPDRGRRWCRRLVASRLNARIPRRRHRMALEEQVRGKRARYSGYRSFQYLEAGVDYTEFKLAREVERVASHKVDVSSDQETRVQKLLEACLVVSLPRSRLRGTPKIRA